MEKLFLLLLLFFCTSCGYYKYGDLTTCLDDAEFSQANFKTDGYYEIDTLELKSFKKRKAIGYIFFYKNGMCLRYTAVSQKPSVIDKEEFYTGMFCYAWGWYSLLGKEIKQESFRIDDLNFPFEVYFLPYSKKIEVIDSVTLLFRNSYYSEEEKNITMLYHFHPCKGCKPDSSKSIFAKHLKKLKKRRNYWTFFGW